MQNKRPTTAQGKVTGRRIEEKDYPKNQPLESVTRIEAKPKSDS